MNNEVINFSNMSDVELELIHKQSTAVQIVRLKDKVTSMEIKQTKHDEEIKQLKSDVNNRITLDHGQQLCIQNAKKRRVEMLWKEGTVNKEIHDSKRKLHGAAGKDLNNSFGVSSYRDIKQKDFEEALSFVKAWRPRLV